MCVCGVCVCVRVVWWCVCVCACCCVGVRCMWCVVADLEGDVLHGWFLHISVTMTAVIAVMGACV